MAKTDAVKNRATAMRVNTVIAVTAASAIFLMVNYLAYRHYVRHDWTQSDYYTLSDKTVQILRDLRVPVKAYVFYQPMNRVYNDIKELLNRYRDVNESFEIEYVDPDRDPARVRFLLDKFKIASPAGANLVVFEQGEKSKYVYDSDIVDIDYGDMRYQQAPAIKAFKGEQEFTSAIVNLTQEKQPVAYFVGGHGEKDIEGSDREGLNILFTLLERENIRPRELILYEKKAVPEDCDLLLIIGPEGRYMEEEKTALREYLEQGGRLMVALDPRTNTGLEPFLREWNVDAGYNMVVDPLSARRLLFFSALNLFVDNYPLHKITADLQDSATLFADARSVKPVTTKPELVATAIVETSPEGWADVDMEEETFQFDPEVDMKGPVPIAVAVEADGEKAGEKPVKNMRMVVTGDSDFLSNGQISNLANAGLLLNMVNWLTSREKLIAIGPKMPEQSRMTLSAAQMNSIFWFVWLGLPGMGVLLGIAVWWRRRK